MSDLSSIRRITVIRPQGLGVRVVHVSPPRGLQGEPGTPGEGAEGAVLYSEAQTLTDPEAAQARSNLRLGEAAVRDIGNGAGTVCAGDDARLSDVRTPAAHTHAPAEVDGLPDTLDGIMQALIEQGLEIVGKADAGHSHTGLSVQVAGTPSVRSLGTEATQACAGNDPRLSDARAPTTHSHADATTSAAGFMSAAMLTKLNGLQAVAPVTAAATTNIGALAEVLNISATGTPTILSFGPGTEGEQHLIVALNPFILAHNATSMLIPGGANFTFAAGDRLLVTSLGGSHWRVDPLILRGGAFYAIGSGTFSGNLAAADFFAGAGNGLRISGRGGWWSNGDGRLRGENNGRTAYAQLDVAGLTARPSTGSNVAGVDALIEGSTGTGTGTPGRLIQRVSAPGSSGSTAQTLRDQTITDYRGLLVKTNQSLQTHRVGGVVHSGVGAVNDSGLGIGTPETVRSFSLAADALGDGWTLTWDVLGTFSSLEGVLHLQLNGIDLVYWANTGAFLGDFHAQLHLHCSATTAFMSMTFPRLPPGASTPADAGFVISLNPASLNVFDVTLEGVGGSITIQFTKVSVSPPQ